MWDNFKKWRNNLARGTQYVCCAWWWAAVGSPKFQQASQARWLLVVVCTSNSIHLICGGKVRIGNRHPIETQRVLGIVPSFFTLEVHYPASISAHMEARVCMYMHTSKMWGEENIPSSKEVLQQHSNSALKMIFSYWHRKKINENKPTTYHA